MQAQCPTSGNVTVTSNADAGTNTLRWAIDCINTVTPLTTIVFNIPAAGVQTISLTGSLPAITKPNALIDGMAIESAVIDGNLISALGEGIVISASNVTVRGLSLTRFNSPAPGGSGIRISGDNATVNNNYLYNNRIGIIVRDISPTGMVDPAVAPLIRDNFIGETASGAASGNSAQGILFENAPSSAIVRNNVISHNGSNGVRANATGGTLRITENSMFCNAAVGIFRLLSPAAPTITEANTQRIRGTASGGNLIEIFTYNDTGCAAGDPCQGRTLLVTTTANALGFWTLNLSAGAVMPGTLVTATRTAGGNDTYAFAGCSAIADCSGFSVSITPTSTTCNGESNGQLTASAPGGSSTTYAWSTGATTPTITGLGPGTYSVTATDAAGCTATASHTLSNPPLLTVGMSGTNITCNGAANGTATATPAGGTPNYQYTWSNGGNSATISNLGPGTYFVTVADANLCRAFGSVSITQPAALSISCAELNPTSTVGGSDGRATVQISAGTAGYTVAWSGAANGSQNQAAAGTATITGLTAGNYNVTVTDANACQQTCNFSIGSPNCNITLQISGTSPTCNGGANGSINLVVSGATGGLNFDWNVNALDGQQNPTGLGAGTYSVTVTDAANCTASTSISLTQPAALSLVCAQLNPVSVIGGSDGRATVQISGGTAGYTVAWSGAANGSQNQAAASTVTITGLIAGNYTVNVIDANGCQQTCNFSIGSPNCNITLQISGTNPTCNGGANGSVNLVVSGATGSLNFDWNVNALDGQQNPTGLGAGTYSVTVTDAANCTASTSISLTQPAALSLVCAQLNPVSVIGGSDGRATVQISGGTAGYTVAWSGAASGSQNQAAAGTATITGLLAGNYTVNVIDANGCQQTCNFSIGSPNCNITLQISGTNPTCNGGSNGSINLVVSGATGGLNFDWNVNALDGQQNPTGLIAGTYSVTVTDAGGCTATRSINLADPPALQLNVSATPETTAGVNDGTATAAATGGTGGYTFAWNNGGNTPTISGLAPGNYSVTVTDGNQCTISGSASVAAGQGGGGACVAQPVYAVAAPARVCQGDTIRLEADDLYPSPNVRYVWFIPNGDSLTTVLPRVGILAASGAYGGQYFALRDSSGCRSIRVGGAPVQVQSLPDDAATVAMLDTVLCAAGTVTLRALPALGGTGRWLPLNAATVDNAASEQTLARNLQRGPNRFVWQVSLEGCAFSAADTVTVTVEAPPVLNDDRYTLQRVQDVLVMEVLLNDNLSGLPDTVLSYLGGPAVGQLELLDGRRFRYTVTEDFRGRVSFQYVVCNPGARCGTACDTATVTIEVLNMPAVPGGLIVDDPGLNGQLTIKGLNGFSRVEMQIFSRWGDLVFEEKQYDNGNPWRGHAHRSGNALPEGAYYYVLRAFDGNVQVGEAQRGVVHLFR